MTEFENALEDCLQDLERGASSVDECLVRYPEHAAQLGSLLVTATRLMRGREVQPSPAFAARVRAQVTQQMQARRRARFTFPFARLAAGFAAVLALLITGTAYAQGALPGDVFYGWKLASEKTWRAISPDPVGTDLAILNRRVDEMVRLGGDSARHSEALEEYLEVTVRLKSEIDVENEKRILPALDSNLEELIDSGILAPALETATPTPVEESTPTQTPTETPTPTPTPTLIPPSTPEVNTTPPGPVEPPGINPTQLPDIVRTVLPDIVPTMRITLPIP